MPQKHNNSATHGKQRHGSVQHVYRHRSLERRCNALWPQMYPLRGRPNSNSTTCRIATACAPCLRERPNPLQECTTNQPNTAKVAANPLVHTYVRQSPPPAPSWTRGDTSKSCGPAIIGIPASPSLSPDRHYIFARRPGPTFIRPTWNWLAAVRENPGENRRTCQKAPTSNPPVGSALARSVWHCSVTAPD